MIDVSFADAVTAFLSSRGIAIERGSFRLDSLDYMSLLLDLETTLDICINDGIFFSQGLPDVETLGGLCERLATACGLVLEGGRL
jgi:hypothetical protein